MKNELKRLRTERGLSQEDLGKKLCVSGAFISLIENEAKPFPMWLAIKISDMFDVSLDELMSRKGK